MGTFSGPNTVNDSAYLYHVCTSSGSFVPSFSGTIEYLVVAGGGGGGMDMGGGGGGGGVLSSTYSVSAGSTYDVVVGAGAPVPQPAMWAEILIITNLQFLQRQVVIRNLA